MPVRGAAIPVLSAVLFGCVAVVPVEDQRWLRARSEHFEVLSSAPRELTVQLAQDLERFRATLPSRLGMEEFEERRIRVVLFGDEGTFAQFRRHPRIQGFMTTSGEGAWLVVNAEPYDRAVSVAFHEFVHLAEYASGGQDRPPWYREGLAELFSTTRFVRGGVEIGRPPLGRKRWLERGNPLPLRRVLTADDVLGWPEPELQTFYAQAWAVMHFLDMGHLVGRPDRSGAVREYLDGLTRGATQDEAFEAAFGATFEEVEREFLGYLADGRLGWTREAFEEPQAATSVSLEPVGRSEHLQVLGDLAFQIGEQGWSQAASIYRAALERTPGSTLLQASLARVLGHQGDPEAERWLFPLGSSASMEPLTLGRAADAWGALARTGTPGACEAAGRLYERSLAIAPGRVASLYGWARCLGVDRAELMQSIELLERAQVLAPFDPQIATALASRRAAVGEVDAARRLVRELAQRPHAPQDDPALVRELARVSGQLGMVPAGPPATRHLSAHLEVDTPRPRASLRTLLPFAEVTGRAGLSKSLLFDVVIAIDQSGSTLAASGMDVDRDGQLGTSRQTVYGELYPSTDPGDEVQAAELMAATRLVQQLHPGTTRVAVIGFGAEARVFAPLGTPAAALEVLGGMRQQGLAYERDGTSLGNALVAASDELVRNRDPDLRRERAIVLLSDGIATWPDYIKGRDHAIEVARELGVFGIRIHAYVIGNLAPLNDDTYNQLAHLTAGRYVPVPDPADVIARLSNLRLTGLQDIAVRNLRTGRDARAVRVMADGSFDAMLELSPGRNEIEIVANVSGREPLREVRTVEYVRPEAVSSGDHQAARAFLGRLHERGFELDALADLERSRGFAGMEQRLEIELQDAEAPEALQEEENGLWP